MSNLLLNPDEKEQLKSESLTNLEGALAALKSKLPTESLQRDEVLLLLARVKDINQSEKLYDSIKYSNKQSQNKQDEKTIENQTLEFRQIHTNRIRIALFDLINRL